MGLRGLGNTAGMWGALRGMGSLEMWGLFGKGWDETGARTGSGCWRRILGSSEEEKSLLGWRFWCQEKGSGSLRGCSACPGASFTSGLWIVDLGF